MIKKVAIVSLSSGIIGEDVVSHEVAIGAARLESRGITPIFMPGARMGIDYLKAHPEQRAKDLIDALADDSIDMILCAIGGDDTYRLLPYLFDDDRLKSVIRYKPFLGFSDSTVNHLMLHKLGIPTFYGQAFLSDVCELAPQMLPYTASYFDQLLQTGRIARITQSKEWYEERSDFSPAAIGTLPKAHANTPFRLLRGEGHFEGKVLGGCLETLFDLFDHTRHADSVSLCRRYQLFPSLADWKGRILFLETSEERTEPRRYQAMLEALKAYGLFDVVSGVLCGKPIDGTYQEEYERILVSVIDHPTLPILTNLPIGHCAPRAILPFGIPARVNADLGEIVFSF